MALHTLQDGVHTWLIVASSGYFWVAPHQWDRRQAGLSPEGWRPVQTDTDYGPRVIASAGKFPKSNFDRDE
jgi:hypothetical protein